MNCSSSAIVAVSGNDVAGFRPCVSSKPQPVSKYTITARVLHWLSALVILWAMISGLAAALLPLGPGIKSAITSLNVSLTTLFIPVFVFRMVYAAFAPRPRQLADRPAVKSAARMAHGLLYILTLIVLLSGVLMMTRDISLFGVISLPNLLDFPALNAQFELVHKYSCRLLALLVLLHVAAVVRHHKAGRKVLSRMT